jgi:hypothetical protein
LVIGGTESQPAQPSPPPPALEARNSYEALLIDAEASSAAAGLSIDDQVVGGSTVRTWLGCGTVAGSPDADWLHEYPRCHLLPSGEVFFSGYAPRWGVVDHDGQPGVWTKSAGQSGQPPGTFSSNWQDIRHDGSSVLFPASPGDAETVMRLGGLDAANTDSTATVEAIAVGGSGDWEPVDEMTDTLGIGDGRRYHTNAVLLPTGGVLVLGGTAKLAGVNHAVYEALLFENGGWHKLGANPVSSRRQYHSTAVLLPDGRVLLGGGDNRDYDYEIFSPAYKAQDAQRPENLVWQSPVPSLDPLFDARVLDYGQRYEIHCDRLPFGVAVRKAVLMAPGSVTHHSDMHQRYVEMKTTVNNGNEAQFDTPDVEARAPRGLYMLFLVTNVPSVSEATWVMFQ